MEQQTLDQDTQGQRKPFRPEMHLSTVGSATYLEVKWRLVWFRDVHPNGVITTELVEHKVSPAQPDLSYAVFRAEAHDNHGGVGVGYGTESCGDFKDYLEKAETRAIGRALATLGYGTQFTADFETGGRMVDNPAQPRRQAAASDGGKISLSRSYSTRDNGEMATPKQVSYARALIKDKELSANWLTTILAEDFNGAGDLAELTKREISQLIEGLKGGRFDPTPADDGIPPNAAAGQENDEELGDPFGELPW